MVSLLALCISAQCCSNKNKNDNENPYGEIGPTNTDGVTNTAVLMRNAKNANIGDRHSQPNNLRNFEKKYVNHRRSAPIPQSSSGIKRALPKLPHQYSKNDDDSTGAIYSTIDRQGSLDRPTTSYHYPDEPVNPTYESIDVESDSLSDALYSKLENGSQTQSTRKYDYPIFRSQNRPSQSQDEMLYQSTSQIYVGASEDPYSSITSQTGGETNYDFGYAVAKECDSNQPSCSNVNSEPSKSNVDQLYTQIRRDPVISKLKVVASHPTASTDCNGYVSSGSDKTSREPSYRYITVRESLDAIRQRLNERQELSRVMPRNSASTQAVREHYYSSIGAGSDYETVQVSSAPAYEAVVENEIGDRNRDVAGLWPHLPTSPIPIQQNNSLFNIGTPQIRFHALQTYHGDAADVAEQSTSSLHEISDELNVNHESESTTERIRRMRAEFFVKGDTTDDQGFSLFSNGNTVGEEWNSGAESKVREIEEYEMNMRSSADLHESRDIKQCTRGQHFAHADRAMTIDPSINVMESKKESLIENPGRKMDHVQQKFRSSSLPLRGSGSDALKSWHSREIEIPSQSMSSFISIDEKIGDQQCCMVRQVYSHQSCPFISSERHEELFARNNHPKILWHSLTFEKVIKTQLDKAPV